MEGRLRANMLWDSIVRYKTERGAPGSKTGYPVSLSEDPQRTGHRGVRARARARASAPDASAPLLARTGTRPRAPGTLARGSLARAHGHARAPPAPNTSIACRAYTLQSDPSLKPVCWASQQGCCAASRVREPAARRAARRNTGTARSVLYLMKTNSRCVWLTGCICLSICLLSSPAFTSDLLSGKPYSLRQSPPPCQRCRREGSRRSDQHLKIQQLKILVSNHFQTEILSC